MNTKLEDGLLSSFKFTSSHAELSPPLNAILNEIPSQDKTLTVAKRIKEKHGTSIYAKNVAETASHNFFDL